MTDPTAALAEALCPACHHRDHDPGSCEWCPRCELHTDEALAWVMRIEPELIAEVEIARLRPIEEAARAMMLAYRDIEGDVINGRTDLAFDALRAALEAE
jgi:hypothetical protein